PLAALEISDRSVRAQAGDPDALEQSGYPLARSLPKPGRNSVAGLLLRLLEQIFQLAAVPLVGMRFGRLAAVLLVLGLAEVRTPVACSGGRSEVGGRNHDLDFGRVDLLPLEVDGDHARERDDQPDHDQLDANKRDGAPINLAGGDRRGELAGELIDVVASRR